MRLVDFKKALNDTNEAEYGFSQTSDGQVREPLARSTQTRRAA